MNADPVSKVDVALDSPARISLRHDDANVANQPVTKFLHQADLIAAGKVAGFQQLLHIVLQTLAALKNERQHHFSLAGWWSVDGSDGASIFLLKCRFGLLSQHVGEETKRRQKVTSIKYI